VRFGKVREKADARTLSSEVNESNKMVDYKLNFQEHIAISCQMVNRKIYSIKRLFQLSLSVKVKFFKTFVMPYFDTLTYCGTLSIYFANLLLTKLCYSYNCRSNVEYSHSFTRSTTSNHQSICSTKYRSVNCQQKQPARGQSVRCYEHLSSSLSLEVIIRFGSSQQHSLINSLLIHHAQAKKFGTARYVKSSVREKVDARTVYFI
jgi:hypothetical protein